MAKWSLSHPRINICPLSSGQNCALVKFAHHSHIWSKTGGALSLESFMHVVDVAEDEGIVDQYESSLVQRVLHFSEAPVKSIMTHRTEVFSLPIQSHLKRRSPRLWPVDIQESPFIKKLPKISGI